MGLEKTIGYTEGVEYAISKKEIGRRKKAYVTLTVSLISGVALGSVGWKMIVPGVVYAMLGISMGLIGAISFKFFVEVVKIRIGLTNELLVRKTKTRTEEYKLKQLVKVETKWTSNKTIREMYLAFDDGRKVAITALEKFRKFKGELVSKLSKKVVIKERHERIGFDHPLFYVMLGLGLGIASVGVFRLMMLINTQQMKIVEISVGLYAMILGGYFVASKPTTRRSGNKTAYLDYIAGITMWIMGLLMLGALMFV